MPVSEVWAEGGSQGTVVINSTDMALDHISNGIMAEHPEVASMIRWGQQINNRRGGLVERDKYVTPRAIYDQMRVAQEAAENDDVVSGVLETTEALAFNKMSVQCDDEDEENVWNQIIEDMQLGARIREMWREMFIVSQCYVAAWWDRKNYNVKGRSKQSGVQRKKKFQDLQVPSNLTILDPLKIVPVGNFMFNQEELAWIATREESYLYDNILSGREEDATIQRLLTGRYDVPPIEQQRLGVQGVGPAMLYALNPANVWRLTATRSQYKPFADVRMKSVFELLDLKNLLREMDRAHLLGATNFIVLIRKGSEHMPAKNHELAALQGSIRALSQIPVIVGDHRLQIDIITPKIDMSLQPEKYNTIDSRITARLYQMFMTGNFAAGAKGDDSIKLLRMVGRGLEARRSAIGEAIERNVLMPIFEKNDQLTQEPHLEFHPKSIAIDFDPGQSAFILDLLDRKHISRGTVLEQIDLNEEDEARRKEREEQVFDPIFKSLTPLQDPEQQQQFTLAENEQLQEFKLETLDKEALVAKPVGVPAPAGSTPTSTPKKAAPVKATPKNADPKSGGRSGGGNRSGGGAAPGSGQGQEKDPRRGK